MPRLTFSSVKILSCILFAVATIFFPAKAQQTTFRTQYNVAIFDLPGSIVQSPAGNYVFTGTNASLGTTGHIFELNPNGNVNWSKAYSAGGLSTQFTDIKNATGGGYIVTGGTGSGCLLARVDVAGNVTWAYRYRVSSASRDYGNRVVQTSDGGFVVAGSTDRVDPDGAGPIARQDSSKMFALKVNSSGTLQWMKTFFYTTSYDDDDYLNDVAEVSDGYVFVGSVTMVAGDGHSDAVVLKTDFSGNLVWARRWGNSNSETAVAIIPNGANEVVMSGDDNGRPFILRINTPNTGPTLTGTNSRYTTAGFGFSAGGSSLVKTIDNHFTVFGTRIGAILTPPFLDYSAFILKTNASNGSVIFNKSYNSGFVSILPVGIQATDTGYVMNSISATLQSASYDYGVVKTDKNGSQGAGSSCPESNPTFTRENYAPSLGSFSPTVISDGTRSNVSLAAANITPTTQIVCRTIACTAPPQPTVSASQNNVCPSTPVTISATGGSNVTYRVYTQASGGTSIGTAPLNVSPTATTTYYVEADDNSNPGCASSRGSVTVTVLTPASISGGITGNPAPCPGSQSYSVSASGTNITYSWSVSGGGSFTSVQNASSTTINWTTPGNHTLSVTVSNTCATVSRTLSVNVAENVSGVTASANPNPICAGNTLSLTGSGTGVTTWSWSGPNSFSANTQNPSVPNIQPNGAGVYTLTGSSACGTMTATVNVTVNDLPDNVTATASPNPACVGNTVNLLGNATGATSWSWTGPGIVNPILTQNASVTNIQTNGAGTYTLRANNSCGFREATVDVVVNEAPTNVSATATPNPACEGGTVNLSGSATGAVSYTWSGPGGFSSSQLNETIGNFQQANVGTYTLNATNTCGTTQGNVSVTISTGPVNVTATANLTNICSEATLELFGNSPNATSYSWTGPNGFSSNLQNPIIPVVTLDDSGTYILTAINDCGNNTASVTIDVDTLIENVSVSALPNDTICVGETINLSASGSNVNSWIWSGPNGFSSQQQNPVLNNATASNSGNYTVTGSNACGNVSETVFVLVNTIPVTPGAISGTNSLCADAATYSITGISNATDYNWTVSGGGTIISGQGTTSVDIAWTGPSGNYTVSVAAANNCGGSSAATLSVTILPAAPATPGNISGNTSVCPGVENYSVANVTDATSYNWTVSGGGTIASGQGTNNISISWTTTGGPYTVSVTASNSCGASVARIINVTVNPAPTSPTITGNNETICEGESATLTATGSTGGTVTYSFYDAATGGNLVGTSPLTVTPSNTITYYLEVVNEFGCRHSTSRTPVTVNVNIAPSDPVLNAGSDVLCYSGTATLTATATPEGSVITWWDAPVNGNQVGTGNTFTTGTITQSTTYYVQATSANGCKNLGGRTTAGVTVIPLPEVTLTTDKFDNAAFPNEIITFTASPSGYDNYEFFVNSVSIQNGSDYQFATSKLNDKDTVSVIATHDGCDSEEKLIVVKILDYPNAFTPNGDGRNDIFLQGYDLIVLNRWGQELYKGLDGWDGTYKGKKVSPGTYFYIMTLKDITDRENIVKGTVMVVQE
jgi:gliding motility-associated-like protein